MRVNHTVGRLFRALLASLPVLAACEDTESVAPPSPVHVEVAPSGSLEMGVGDTLTLRVTLQNAPAGTTATFSTSDPAVANVSPAGLVSALAPGLATITVAPSSDPSNRVAVAVHVLSRTPLPPPASVAVEGVVTAANQPVDPDSVAGTVFVRVNAEVGGAQRLEVLLDGTIACTQAFGASAAAGAQRSAVPVSLVCPVNTARFDTISGAPTFPNRRTTLAARLVGAQGNVLASGGGLPLNLVNPPALVLRVRAVRVAADSAGRQWLGGDVAVSALPVFYSTAERPGQATFALHGRAGPIATVTDAAPPFEGVFRDDEELQGVLDDSLRVTVSTTTAAGSLGPTATTGLFRYDDSPPVAGSLRSRAWVGAETVLASLYERQGERDLGVGGVFVRTFAGDPGLGPLEVISRGREVTRGSELAESSSGAYRLAALACDALENCTVVQGSTFCVDLFRPGIVSTGVAERAVNPGGSLSLVLEDSLSGFGGNPVIASVRLLDVSPSTEECGPAVDGADLPGRVVGGACVGDTVSAVLPVPHSTAGYYTYTLLAVDQAGNRSAPVTRTLLVDRVAPEIAELTLPTRFAGGAETRVSGVVADNLDLAEGSVRLVYPAPGGGASLALPFAAAVRLGTAFDEQLVTRAPFSVAFPFVRTLTYGAAATNNASTGRTTVLVDSLRVRVVDAASQVTRASRAVPPSSLDNTAVTDPFPGVLSAVPSLRSSVVCTRGCVSGDVTSTAATLRASGGGGARTPFERVYLFLRRADGTVDLIDSTATASVEESGGRRTFTYTLPYEPPAGLAGELSLFFVGVNGAGNGLRSEGVQIQLFTR